MICPCCGQNRQITAQVCAACGARQVGEPLTPPDIILPKLGPAILAFSVAAIVIVTFLAVWIFGNDMKVGRVMLVSVLGDGTKLTEGLLKADPRLPNYRIFSYDAYRLAFLLSLGLIPLSLLGIWLARRASRLARQAPENYGGMSMARFSYALSTSLALIFGAVTMTSIPGAIERGRAKRIAATRAMMYELHEQALQKYYNEYGSYPQDLSDLIRVNAESSPQSDYWRRNLNYLPVGVVASKGSAISFSNYKLVSAGPDGEFGTEDDITMVDGMVIEGQSDGELPTTMLTPDKTRQ